MQGAVLYCPYSFDTFPLGVLNFLEMLCLFVSLAFISSALYRRKSFWGNYWRIRICQTLTKAGWLVYEQALSLDILVLRSVVPLIQSLMKMRTSTSELYILLFLLRFWFSDYVFILFPLICCRPQFGFFLYFEILLYFVLKFFLLFCLDSDFVQKLQKIFFNFQFDLKQSLGVNRTIEFWILFSSVKLEMKWKKYGGPNLVSLSKFEIL